MRWARNTVPRWANIVDEASVDGSVPYWNTTVWSATSDMKYGSGVFEFPQGNLWLSPSASGDGIQFDDQKQKRISWNDGGGNFTIRSGGYFNAGEKYLLAGDGAAVIALTSDGAAGSIVLKAAPAGVNADDPITYGGNLQVVDDGIEVASGFFRTGHVSFDRYTTWGTEFSGAGGGAGIINDNGTYQALMVVGNTSGGGTRQVQVWDDLEVKDDLTVDGNLTVNTDRTGGNGITIDGPVDSVKLYMDSGDEAWLVNSQQNNGVKIYDGTGGVEILYNGGVRLEMDSTYPLRVWNLASSTAVFRVDDVGDLRMAGDQIFFGSLSSNDYLQYHTTSEYFRFVVNNTEVFRATSTGYVHSGGNRFYFGIGSDDYILLAETANQFKIYQDGVNTFISGTSASAAPGVDNTYSCGSSTLRWTAVWAVDGSINTSDPSVKDDLTDSDLGLEFVRRLRPVRWRWVDGVRPHYGLDAVQVKETIDALGIDFGGFVDPTVNPGADDEGGPLGLRYHEFIGPLVKAVQELADRVDRLESV